MTDTKVLAPPNLDGFSVMELHERHDVLVKGLDGNYDNASEEVLAELIQITAALRRKSSGPPKSPRKPSSRKAPPTLENLFE